MSRRPPKPNGAKAVRESPEHEIELMLWSSGDEPVYVGLSVKQALTLAHELIELARDDVN